MFCFSSPNVSLLRRVIPIVDIDLFGDAILQIVFLVIAVSYDLRWHRRLVVLHLALDGEFIILTGIFCSMILSQIC